MNCLLIIFAFLAWLVLIIAATLYGSDRKIGAFLAFLTSFIFSPIIGFIIAYLSGKNEENLTERKFYGWNDPYDFKS